ncbi:MAG: Gfo/Idh/MocA family oxidoreductase, partial [Bifidobacteriaceae bacterium]|nr:Gfo/Idh/MocA family oxidoreductase [Bifidobacteriaceae bacterium]
MSKRDNAALRVVLVGAGRFGTLHTRVWREIGAQVVGVVDTDPTRAANLAKRFNAVAGTSLTAVAAQAGANTAVVASDESTHAALAC